LGCFDQKRDQEEQEVTRDKLRGVAIFQQRKMGAWNSDLSGAWGTVVNSGHILKAK
jgi:hypothetical protein